MAIATNTSLLIRPVRWSYAIVLLLFASLVTAEESCPYPGIESAFKDYVAAIDQARVEEIQQQLNDGKFGEVSVDGVLGIKTRLALQRVCQAFAVPESDAYAEAIVAKLELNSAIIPSFPEWRQTIDSDSFKSWLSAKPTGEQAQLTEILATGPAAAIIKLLNNFASAAVVAAAPSANATSEPETKPKKEIKLPLTDDITVYYSWPGADAKPAGDDGEELPKIENEDVAKQMDLLKGVAYPNRELFEKALETTFTAANKKREKAGEPPLDYQPYKLEILYLSRHETAAAPAAINLQGDGCGCSREFAALVYGFYPSWLALKEQSQAVDFSLFDRIGYYTLTLDEEGKIPNPLQWQNDMGGGDFINMAHKYRVAVDLTLHASGWRGWSDAVIGKAVESTVATLYKKFDGQGRDLDSYIAAVRSKTMADGVTLYFDDYSAAGAGRENIVKFIKALANELNVNGRKLALNLMLGIDTTTFGNGQTVFKELEPILLESKGQPAKVDNILILLQEPTTDAKKQIRRKVEDEFHGAKRKEILRKIIPVISPIGHDPDASDPFRQVTDDLIYFQDNFAGAGFWPLPLPGDTGFVTLKEKIITLYSIASESNHLGNVVSGFAPQLCQFACPNRWYFRLGFDLLAAALFIYALCAIWFNRPREIFQQYLIPFIALIAITVLITVVSLICDPYWQQRADLVLICIIVAGIAYSTLRYIIRVKQSPLP